MGLFQNKRRPSSDDANAAPAVDAAEAAGLMDDALREELRSYGREQYKQIIAGTAEKFQQDLDASIPNLADELKSYMTKQLDSTIARVNAGISEQLNQRLAEYDRLVKDAQDTAVQSLNKNAQALHEKYQQMTAVLQQTVSSQEVQMISVFEEQKARLNETHQKQDEMLTTLSQGARISQQQVAQIAESTQKVIADQQAALEAAVAESNSQIAATKQAQDSALATLNNSAQALEAQSNQLGATLNESVAKQKEIMTRAFEDNMAQVIEHYLLGAFGDQYDMKAQVPLIIQQMTDNKQAIMDDMTL